MQTLKEILLQASREGWAVPHFNISNLEMLKAIIAACVEKRSPAMIGTSESEREFIGLDQAVVLIKSYRDEYTMPFFLNADHTKSVEKAKEAIDAGYDSIHIDLSKKSLEENIAGTREVVAYARSKDVSISVEGEIGYFMTDSSKVYDTAIDVPTSSLAQPDEAERFVKETDVDRLAPVVGGIHGVEKGVSNKLDVARIARIRRVVGPVALVLHGGSGDALEDIKRAIAAGIANIHISTDLRVAYVNALKKALQKEEYAPYKLLEPAVKAVKAVVASNIDLFSSAGKV